MILHGCVNSKVIHYTYTYLLYVLFHDGLSLVPCAMQQDLVAFISFLTVVCKIQDSDNIQRVPLVDVYALDLNSDGAKPCLEDK